MSREEMAIEIRELGVMYPDFHLKIDEFNVPKGYVMGVIGKNGAGKSTMIRSMLDLVERYRGEITILGMNFKDNEIALKNKIGYVNDHFVFPEKETPKSIAKYLGSLYEHFDNTYYEAMLTKHNVDLRKKFKEMSKGMRAKFSIIFALSHDSDVIILDEPTANLDPLSRREILDLLYDVMQSEEKTILFSTHITSDLDKIADYVTFIDHGKVEFTMSKDEMQAEYQIVRFENKVVWKELKHDLRGVKEFNGYYEGLCTRASHYLDRNDLVFRKANIEDLMVYWEFAKNE